VRALGVDPGTATTGYGVVDQDGADISAVAYGCIVTSAAATLPERLLSIHQELGMLVDRYRPDVVAVEQLFFSKNVQTAFSVGQARGVVLLTVSQRGLTVYEYTPPQVKLATVGYGSATKEQMQLMIQRLLGLPSPPHPDDAADALAIAVCHLRGESLRASIQRAVRQLR